MSQVVIAWYSWLSSLTQGPILVILGTALPLLALAAVVSLGWGAADRLAGGVARWHRPVKWVAGAAFILAGLHDTLIYWWL